MSGLVRGYGRALVTAFFVAVGAWAALLIVAPQATMLERALTPPKRQLDSAIAGSLSRDAETCISVLRTYETAEGTPATSSGGLAVPSASTMAVPSVSGMAVPSASGMNAGQGAAATRPYILQCDRADTRKAVVRDGPAVFLDDLYDLPRLAVSDTAPIPEQIETARRIADLAEALRARLVVEEASRSNLTLANFEALTSPVLIPLTEEMREAEAADPLKQVFTLVGLRFVEEGQVHERIGLVILARTLVFAVAATALALVLCYPIAYKVALATPPDRAIWLFLALVIPYAIVELMRVYAWTAIVDNRGLLNSILLGLGAIAEPIQFKRSALTVFVVIVYTYVLFMVFPMVNVMSTLDRNQIEAARDLGASTWRVHWRIVIPHAKPGIAVGCIATFMLSAGAFSVPRIISRGLQSEWFAQTIYNKFFESENSNVGAAYSFAYTLVCFVLVALFMWAMRTRLKDFASAR